MLNELYDAASKLADSGISPKDWHKEYVPVRKPSKQKPAFFVCLDELGAISDVERVDDPKIVGELMTWESKGDLRQSFPYFNIPPLLWIRFDPSRNEDDKRIDKALKASQATSEHLSRFMARVDADESTKPWQENAFNKLQSNLDKGKALTQILGSAPADYQSIVTLIDRLEHLSAQTFHANLLDVLKNKMLRQPETAAKYSPMLFYSGKKKPGNDLTILLELAGATEYPVKHEKVRDWINTRLLSENSVRGSNSCASDIFGLSSEGAGEKFADVRMKNVLGNVKLRSMAKDARCQHRYGNAEGDSCPVGHESRSKMKGALEWLTAPNREGKTWTTVSRAAGNEEILLAYPSELPPEPPDTAMFFGGSSGVDTDNTARFEICAQNVTRALRGLMAKNPKLDIRVFLLRKMDATRRRISSDKRCSAQHFIQAAERWQVGSRNLPHVLVMQFTKTAWREPQTPFPMETVWTLNTLWVRRGEKSGREKQPTWSPSRTKSISTADALALLLEDSAFLRPVLDRMMYAATRNLMGLVLALGQAHAQGQVFKTQKNYARQALIMPSVLGLLLNRLNITKEHYMKSAPYLVGRLLSLADQLHYHYCKHVRDGSVPAQLMGNALMATALEEPVKALALYCNRILPYQAWARTVSGDAAGLARYFLSELGKVSSELGDVCSEVSSKAIPERCIDADKAQILIGYLARPEKSDSSNS